MSPQPPEQLANPPEDSRQPRPPADADRQAEVIIVGAGPIGLELAVVLKHMGVDYLHLDAGQVGQTVTRYPQQTRFFSSPERIAIAGVPLTLSDHNRASREQYLAYLRSVVQQFDLKVNTFERVTDIKQSDGEYRFTLHTDRRGTPHTYQAKHLVLAVGDMHGPRKINVPGEDLPHVSHYFDEPHRYFNQRLLIVGGRNSAVETALRCYHAGAQVSLSYRWGGFDERLVKYGILPEIKALIEHERVKFYPYTLVREITAEHVVLEDSGLRGQDAGPGVTDLATTPAEASGELTHVPADFVLLLTGYVMNTELFAMAGVELVGENCSPKHDLSTMETNVPGLYVAGTAAAGTQVRFRLFIENCHPHVAKIARNITGQQPPMHLINQAAKQFALPES
ncbi:NAD(P)-binding domain-containing protein [Phycisphaerales bacterium AB-hyl4]|uniref:NAD(P)-binding domain-containing protein n=1 Tax=Natronomicrosphaera hydrolytica TaxID=3242702 RepID=A0ABV4U959_9BACT